MMDSLENNNNILRQTCEPVEQTHDMVRGKTSFEMPWVSPLVLSAASHSAVPEPLPDSTFSSPLSASRCLSSAWSGGPSYPYIPVASDQGFIKSDSGLNDVVFRPHDFNPEQTGYLLPCNTTTNTDQVNSVTDWRPENMLSTLSPSYDARQMSMWGSFAASRQFEEHRGGDLTTSQLHHVHAQPAPIMPSFHDIDSVSSSTGSSTTSLSSQRSTLVSTPVDELPTFMSPVETAKPCPQYCRCHGYTPFSLANNHGNMFPMPDLLHNTKPDQFSTSSTSSTMCMTSPLVYPGPFQPAPTSFQPFRPGFADDEGRNSSASSTSSLSLASSASIASELKPAPHDDRKDGAYPVQVVASAWLTSLVDQGNFDKGIENEPISSTAASMITNPVLETEHTQVSLPTSFSQTAAQNCDKPDDEALPLVLGTTNSATIHATSDYCSTPDYHQSYHAYPRPYLTRLPTENPARPLPEHPFYPPSEYPAYPPPEYPAGHSTLEYHAHPTTPAYQPHPTYPPPGYPGSILMSRLVSRSFSPYDDWRVGIQHPPDRRGFPSPRDSGRPRTAAVAVNEQEKQPLRQRPSNRSGKRLVDQFPDLLPVIAWCLNYPQTSTSSSKPSLSTTQIREIVIEGVPGIKERGGIGISTIMKLVQELKRKIRNKVSADQAKAATTPMTSPAPSSTPLSSQENYADHPKAPADSVSNFPIMKENSAEHPAKAIADSISSSTTKEDDTELPKAPTESILRSIMKLVDDVANPEKHSKSTASLVTSKTASMTTSRNEVSHHHALENEAQQKTDANTATASFGYDNDTRASIFRALMDAHDITVDEVKGMRTSESFFPPSACINGYKAQSPVKSDFQPKIAAPDDKGIDVATGVATNVATDSAKCNDYDSDEDIMVIDTASQNI